MREIWLIFLLSFIIVKSDLPPVDLLQYENFTLPDITTVCSYFGTATNVSKECGEQLEIVCRNSTLLFTMFDASSKFPYSGLDYSTRSDLGNFDQCLTIDYSYNESRILGEYCVGGLWIPDFSNLSDTDLYFKLAVCRPNACKATDFNAIVAQIVDFSKYLNFSLEIFQDISCQTVESNTIFSGGDLAVIFTFAFFIVLMILSTGYDVYLYLNKLECFHPVLLSFSVLSNGRKLLHISKRSTSKEHIEVFQGFRVVSIMWIVAGHGFVMWQYIVAVNVDKTTKWSQELYAFYISAGTLAVDTFFYMSGFLLAFQYCKGKAKPLKEQLTSIPHMYIHRYLRLTPAMLMIYLLTITVFIYTGYGPIWSYLVQNDMNLCKTYWWRFFLYIQNYYDSSEFCLVPMWYLSADMQLFLLSPIILIPLSLQLEKYGFKVVMTELFIWNIFWTFLPMGLSLAYPDYNSYFNTHTRAINYFIGMTLGIFMRVKIDKPFLYVMQEKHRNITNLIIWILILPGMLATAICYQDETVNHGTTSKSVYDALMRPAWCMGLSWITYSCYHGYGGFVNWILCRPLFQILARLTYCTYLVHMTVIEYYVGTMRTKLYFDDYHVFYEFCGHYTVSMLVATFWTLAFESPLITLEKFLLGGSTKLKEPKNVKNGTNEDKSKVTA